MTLSDYIVVDVETTGLDPAVDRVIEVALVGVQDGVVTHSWSRCVDPGYAIPPAVVALTGITQDDVAGVGQFDADLAACIHVADDAGACAYNAAFDRAMLNAEMRSSRHDPLHGEWLDPFVLSKVVCRARRFDKGYRLGEVAARLKVVTPTALHRALADATCTHHVVQALRPFLPPDLADVMRLQRAWVARQTAVYGPDDRTRKPTWRVADAPCSWACVALDIGGEAASPWDVHIDARREVARRRAPGWHTIEVASAAREPYCDEVFAFQRAGALTVL